MTIRMPLPIAVLACVGAFWPMAPATAYQARSPARIESTRGQANGQSNGQTRADSRAQKELPEGGVGGLGDCCEANGSPGCDDPACEAAVCAIDAFCCDFEWDAGCAIQAGNVCLACGAPSNCCAIHNTPGCDVPSCEAAVCAVLPVCCNVAWGDDELSVSAICVDTAIELCDGLCDFIADGCGDPASGTCCEENGTSFCDDPDCCTDVCLGDPNDPLQPPDSWCCLVEWDTLCKQQATNNALCDCDGEAGDCCVMNFDFPGCNDADCQECVCAADGFCCRFAWGPTCVDLAEGDCLDECGCDHPIPNCPNSNNNCCFAGFDEPGCEDEKCCDLVCAQDAFCCESVWDFACADAAMKLCDPAVCGFGICPGTIASALPASGTVDARQPFPPSGGPLEGIGSESEPIVITIGETGAGADCFTFCESDVTTSDCCEAHESPGCDDKACANAVCADDGFCCNVVWDGNCAKAAIQACGDLCFGGFGPNSIAGVTDNGDGTYTIVLERAIAPNTAAIITYDDGSSVTYISHPANVNADAISNANDVLSLIDILNGVATPPFGNYSGDIDRSGQIGASDVLRTIDLLNGASALPNQLGEELPGAPNCDGDGGGGEGNCCIANGSPGCDDPDCEAAICAADPFCCDVTWDDVCAEDAVNEPLCDCG